MTNINCTANCIYQKDGKCSYDNTMLSTTVTFSSNCAYFSPSPKKK